MAKMYFENNRFSERENDVIKLLIQGKSNKQIALALGISNRTVEFHLSNIYTKLGVKSRSEAILKVTNSQLRKSTGDVQVISAVDNSLDSIENGFKSILWRITMKKPYYVITGLSTAILLFITVFCKTAYNPNAIQSGNCKKQRQHASTIQNLSSPDGNIALSIDNESTIRHCHATSYSKRIYSLY